MDSFDTLTMSYLARPISLPEPLTAPESLASLPPTSTADQSSLFEGESFIGYDPSLFWVVNEASRLTPGSEHAFGRLSSSAHHKHLSSSYDEILSEMAGSWNSTALERDTNAAATASTMGGQSTLLEFGPPRYSYPMLDVSGRQVSLSLAAQLHGMFFLAESPWSVAGDASAPLADLTCYRRNLFQISGSVALPRAFRYIVTEHGEQIPVIAQEITVSATESVEGNPVKIISVPWKAQMVSTAAEDKVEKEPLPIPLDLRSESDGTPDSVTIPVSWKRLQFRIATANNGRRKELQQHFAIALKVVATLANGASVVIAEVRSGAIIVRGRSPRNFLSRRDFPLSGSSTSSRRAPSHHSGHARSSPANAVSTGGKNSPDFATSDGNVEENELQLAPDLLEWMSLADTDTGAFVTPLECLQVGAHDCTGSFVPSPYGFQDVRQAPPSTPVNLSLLDDEQPRKRPSPATVGSSKRPNKHLRVSPVASAGPYVPPPRSVGSHASETDEITDVLYGSFPPGLDDWVPPVDAVYRPHATHQTNVPPDLQAQAVRGQSNRYLVGDGPF